MLRLGVWRMKTNGIRVELVTAIVNTRRVPVQRAVERDEIPYP